MAPISGCKPAKLLPLEKNLTFDVIPAVEQTEQG
jgi:hypothetical protein